MSEAARGLRWTPFPTPASIRSQPYAGQGACTYCGSCTWNGCRDGAKALPSLHGMADAERSGALVVRTGARATRLLADDSRGASGVEFVQDRTAYRQPARAVVLATYTYENVRLLLLSASPAFPRGLANNAGNVGRHFMTHSFPMTLGVFPGRDLRRRGGTAAQAAAVADFDADNIDHAALGFIGGSVLMTPAEDKAIFNALWTPPSVPRWGTGWKRWLHDNARSIGWVWTLPDVLPYEQNVLDLDPVARDRDGVPRVRCTYRYFDNEVRQTRFLLDRAREWLLAAGAAQTWHLPEADAGDAPTPTAAPGWATTRRPRWSTAGARSTRCLVSWCSAPRRSRRAAGSTPPRRSRPSPCAPSGVSCAGWPELQARRDARVSPGGPCRRQHSMTLTARPPRDGLLVLGLHVARRSRASS